MLEAAPRIWQVGALCRAVANALDARFNPVVVLGEISGLSRVSSGHCYFSLKDASGQIRCAMFKRAFGLLTFAPRDGDLVEVRGRLGLYEPRGDLQLVVESMRAAGAGQLFEQFVQLKAKLDAEGLFRADRKRPLPVMPRGIGVVTSLGSAALHDVVSALRRRVPHVPVVIAPALVQGAGAPSELCRALSALYQWAGASPAQGLDGSSVVAGGPLVPMVDVILLVRGGGSLEDLWAFNDESLARTIARSPVPTISGVGHETDFTIADFVADLRAPTPTAAAELAARPREVWLGALELAQQRLQDALVRGLDSQAQLLDNVASRLGRPSTLAAVQRSALASLGQRLRRAARFVMAQQTGALQRTGQKLPEHLQRGLKQHQERLVRAGLRLDLLDPLLVLERGYAWLADENGRTITSPSQVRVGGLIRATLAEGSMNLLVPPEI